MNEFSDNYIMVEHNETFSKKNQHIMIKISISGSLNTLDWYERPRVEHSFNFMYVSDF